MAGIAAMYAVGPEGYDGLAPVEMVILVGVSSRMWLEPRYLEPPAGARGRGLGRLAVVVPAGPQDPNMLLDALLAFYPAPFRRCPSFEAVLGELGGRERLDFDLGPPPPPSWEKLREEARPIYEAALAGSGESSFGVLFAGLSRVPLDRLPCI